MFTMTTTALWRSPLLHPFNDLEALDAALGFLAPTVSLRHIRARVVDVVVETADTRTFVLRPNRRWRGHRAGQHVVVEVEIDGARRHRSFSISSAPGDGRTIAITVKRQPGAKVSGWMHDNVRPGHVLTLSAAAGAFVVAPTTPRRLLLLAAGSGITPIRAILRDLNARGHAGEIFLVHCSRMSEDAIFAAELDAMAQAWPSLRIHRHFTASAARLDATRLEALVPGFAHYPTLLCGPSAFAEWVHAAYAASGTSHLLQSESFGGRVLPRTDADASGASAVHCTRSERSFTARGTAPLLAEAEAAGLAPRHGCRIGICHTCRCVKRSGTVVNLLTGVVSSEPGETIQLCITAARSDLELAL